MHKADKDSPAFLLDCTRSDLSPTFQTMSGISPVVLILGAGPKVGLPTAQAFASKGYKVAVAARSLNEADSTASQLNIKSDFANPDDVVNAFVKVKRELGIPSVVIYNGMCLHQRTLAECLLSVCSRRRDILSPKRPVCHPVGCFQARHDRQQHECFCRCPTSRPRLRRAPCRCAKGVCVYGQHPKRQAAPAVPGIRRRQVGICAHDDGCCR